jgi:hypothetical protein
MIKMEAGGTIFDLRSGRFPARRQGYGELRTLARPTGNLYPPLVIFDDPEADRQAQSGAVFLGREKRLEDLA